MARKKSGGLEAPVRQIPDLPFEVPADLAKVEKADGETDGTTTIAALQEQIKLMQANQKALEATNLALMQQAPVVTPQLLPTEVDTKGLPDPVTDPEAYAKELQSRMRTAFQNEQKNQQAVAQAQTSQQGKIDALWEDFKEQYGDYAEQAERMQYIATKLANRAAQRGRDVGKYMFASSPQFFADAVALYDKEFGKPGSETADDDDDGGSLLEADEIRTAGIPGGGPKGRQAPKDEDDIQGKSIMQGVREWQQKSGFSI